MKKMLAMLLVMICFVSTSFAEGIIVLPSPDANNAPVSGSPDDMKLGEEIDMGDFIYIPQGSRIGDESYGTLGSPDGEKLLILWIDVLNYSNKERDFFKDVDITVTYESERGPFQFSVGGWGQCEQSCGDVSSKAKGAIKPLHYGYYLFFSYVPDYVVNNSGELKMEITTEDTTLTYYFRR